MKDSETEFHSGRGVTEERDGKVVMFQLRIGGAVMDLGASPGSKVNADTRAARFLIEQKRLAAKGQPIRTGLYALGRAAAILAPFIGDNDPAADVELGRKFKGRKRKSGAARVSAWEKRLADAHGERWSLRKKAEWIQKYCEDARESDLSVEGIKKSLVRAKKKI